MEKVYKAGKIIGSGSGEGKLKITNTSEYDVRPYATAQVVDTNLKANNIRNGTSILGITGTLKEGITPTGNIDITSNDVFNVTNYATAQVKSNTLRPENIKKDTNILGVVGTYDKGGITPSGTINITSTKLTDVTNYANAQVVDANLKPENIKKGTSILGIAGSVNEGINPQGNIDILDTQITDVTKYATAKVVDNNLVPSNIRKDTTILGVKGTLESGGGGTSLNSFRTKISFSVNGVDVQQNSLLLYQIMLLAPSTGGGFPVPIFNIGDSGSDFYKTDVNYPVMITSDISNYQMLILGLNLEFDLPENVDGLTCKLLINDVEVADNIAFDTSSGVIINNIDKSIISTTVTPELANAWKNSFAQADAILDFKFVFY